MTADSDARPGECAATTVSVKVYGVYVGDRRVAEGAGPFVEHRVLAVRKRLGDDWWRHAAAIIDAESPQSTGGPVGLGVDFFADEYGDLIPADVRQRIQDDAYEAAREVIVEGIQEHLGRMVPAVLALPHSGSSHGARDA